LEKFHYSQAVKVENRVEISGQGGWNNDWEWVLGHCIGVLSLGDPKMRVEIRVTAIIDDNA
jgi:enamine deaminase RidA (YjgF/YER057c/UK114 family)